MNPPATPLSLWHGWIKPVAVAFLVLLCRIFVLFSLTVGTGCSTKPPSRGTTNTVYTVITNKRLIAGGTGVC